MRSHFDELVVTALAMFMILIAVLIAWSSLNSMPQQEPEPESKMVRSMPLADEPEISEESNFKEANIKC